MHYDPVKNVFASVIKKNSFLRILFYKLLDMMFLRSWYVRREIKEAVKEINKKDISIYDAGTGFGQYTYFMAKNFPQSTIVSVDVKEDYISDCRFFFNKINLRNVSFAIEDLTAITHKEKFDLIICVDVMEHIENDVLVFKNYYNALKPGGILIVNTPSIFGGSDVHDEHDESFIGEHFRDGYSAEDFKTKLEPLGFTMRKVNYTYGFWGDKAWRLAIKYPILILNFSKLMFIFLPFYYLIFLPVSLLFMYMDFKSKVDKGTGIIISARK